MKSTTKEINWIPLQRDDDGPVGQTGSEAALKTENVVPMAQA
jgi:hypothetical protein